jgi:hypothetical protein
MSGQASRTLWLAEQDSRTSRKLLQHKSRGRRTLDAPTAAPLNLCRRRARAHPSGGADIAMRCIDCESASEMNLVLSPRSRRHLASASRFRTTQRCPENLSRSDFRWFYPPRCCISAPPATGRPCLARGLSCKTQVLRSGAEGIRTPDLRRAKATR